MVASHRRCDNGMGTSIAHRSCPVSAQNYELCGSGRFGH